MPKYKVNVTGPNDAADVTHLTVNTTPGNGSNNKAQLKKVNDASTSALAPLAPNANVPYVAPLVPRSDSASVRVSKSNKERRNRNKAQLNAAATRRANNTQKANNAQRAQAATNEIAATDRIAQAEALAKGETIDTEKALMNKTGARRSRNMAARVPPAPSNFALRPAAPQPMPRLAPGSRLPPLQPQTVVPELQSLPKPPARNPPPLGQTLPSPPQTRSSKTTLMKGRNNQLGNIAPAAENNEESSDVVPARSMPAPSAKLANDDEFPTIEGGRRTRRIHRKHAKHSKHSKERTHRKHAKQSNKSKKRK